jgi:hypothetical protein
MCLMFLGLKLIFLLKQKKVVVYFMSPVFGDQH